MTIPYPFANHEVQQQPDGKAGALNRGHPGRIENV
jgi:hypothetical protein